MKATVLSSCIVQYIPNPVAHKHSVCAHSRLHRTTPLFLSPLLCLEGSIERWQICQCQQTAVFAAAGSGHTHSVTHTHAAHTHSAVGILSERVKFTSVLTAVSLSLPVSTRPHLDPVTLQSPYTLGQNAGTTPLVYSPPTQPMNAQPQSRPVSACDSMSSFQIRLLLEMLTFCWVLCCCLWCGLWSLVGAVYMVHITYLASLLPLGKCTAYAMHSLWFMCLWMIILTSRFFLSLSFSPSAMLLFAFNQFAPGPRPTHHQVMYTNVWAPFSHLISFLRLT